MINLFRKISQKIKAIGFVLLSLLSISGHAQINSPDAAIVSDFDQSLQELISALPTEDIGLAHLREVKPLFLDVEGQSLLLAMTLKRIDRGGALTASFENDILPFINALSSFYYRLEISESDSELQMFWNSLVAQYQFYSVIWQLENIYQSISNRHVNILHNVLPVSSGGSFDSTIQEGNISASYHSQNYPEIKINISSLIEDKAQALDNSPVNIFNHVAFDITREYYWGSRKGVEAVLATTGANDADQAVLLQHLLMAAGYQAHLVSGVQQLSLKVLEEVTGLLGIENNLTLLRKSGQKFELNQSSSGYIFSIQRVWVSALVPYDNYRGTGIDDERRSWIPLDPFFYSQSRVAQFNNVDTDKTLNAIWLGELFNADQVSPVIRLANDYSSEISQDELEGASISEKVRLTYLPTELSNLTERIIWQGNELPDEYINYVNIRMNENNSLFNNELIDTSIPMTHLFNKNVSLSFIGATQDDEEIIRTHGGIHRTPLNLVELRPVLKIDERIVALAEGTLSAGQLIELNLGYSAPLNTSASKVIIAGSHYSLAIGGGEVIEDSTKLSQVAVEADGAANLSKAAYRYQKHTNLESLLLGDLLSAKLIYPQPSLTIVANGNRINYLGSQPVFLSWTGVEMDALVQPASVISYGNYTVADIRRFSALNASWQEQNTFETFFDLDSVSADVVLSLADAQGIPILRELDFDEIESAVYPDEIKKEIKKYIDSGFELYIPQDKLQVDQWSGFGWVAVNPVTGASGYFLSGGIAGASSVNTDGNSNTWSMINPSSTVPVSGTDKVRFLFSNIQPQEVGVAGETAEMAVIAYSRFFEPVRDAEITVTVVSANATIEGDVQTSFTGFTDSSGVFEFEITYSENVNANLHFLQLNPEDKYPQKVSQVWIDASVSEVNPVKLDSYLFGYYGPDKPIKYKIEPTSERKAPIYGAVYDKYDNAVANVPYKIEADGFSETEAKPSSLVTDQGHLSLNLRSSHTNLIEGVSGNRIELLANKMVGDFCNTTYRFKAEFELEEGSVSEELFSTQYCKPYEAKEGQNKNKFEHRCSIGITSLKPTTPDGKNSSIMLKPEQTINDALQTRPRLCEITIIRDIKGKEIARKEALINKIPKDGLIVSEAGTVFGKYKSNYIEVGVKGTVEGEYAINYRKHDWFVGDYRIHNYFTVNPLLVYPDIAATKINSNGTLSFKKIFDIDYSVYSLDKISLVNLPVVALYEDERVINVVRAEDIQSSGKVSFPKGTYFDVANHDYFLELIANHGDEFEVRSERTPLLSNLIIDSDDYIVSKRYVDLSGQSSCDIPERMNLVLSEKSNVTVTAISLITSESKVVGNEVLDKGNGFVEINTGDLQGGKYKLLTKVIGLSTKRLKNVVSILSVEINKTDVLPVAHATYSDVDLHDGSLAFRRDDFSLPGEDVSLSVSRQYSSSPSSTSYFGPGWSDLNYHRLVKTPCGTIIANGIRFTGVVGNYSATAGYHANLEYNVVDAVYELSTKAGVKYKYIQYDFLPINTWLLASITPVKGPSISYEYKISTLGKPLIANISDSYGRTLTYEYQQFTNEALKKLQTRVKRISYNNAAVVEYEYDEHIRLESVTFKKSEKETVLLEAYTYPELVSVTKESKDEDGYPIIKYPTNIDDLEFGLHLYLERGGLLKSITNAEGHKRSISYSYNTEEQSPYSAISSNLHLFEAPYVSSQSDPMGSTTHYDFQRNPDAPVDLINEASVVNISGTAQPEMSYSLNSYGSILTQTNPAGSETTIWNPKHLLPEKTIDKNGNVVNYQYDENGNRIRTEYILDSGSIVETAEFIPQETHTGALNLMAMVNKTDGEGRSVSYKYDNKDCPYPTRQSYPLRNYKYNEECRLKTEQGDSGHKYNYSYDKYGNRALVTGPAVSAPFIENFSYNNLAQLVRYRDFSGDTFYEYDILGNVENTTRAGQVTVNNYDLIGRKKTTVDPLGRESSYDYDNNGNLLFETHLRGCSIDQNKTLSYLYDSYNNRKTAEDWKGNVTSFEYDTAGRLEAIREPLGKSTTYGLDNNGNRETETVTQKAGVRGTIVRTFDALNRLKTEQDAEGYVQNWQYDKANNVKEHTSVIGLVTTSEYDDNNQLIKTIERGLPARTIEYLYDNNGWMSCREESGRSTAYQHNGLGGVQRESTGEGLCQLAGIGYSVSQFLHDPKGNVIQKTDAAGDTTKYEYNKLYQRTLMTNPLGEETIYNNDLMGRLLTQTDPNKNQLAYTYNASDLPTSLTDSKGKVFERSYDCQGNLKTEIDGRGNATTHEYNELHQKDKTLLATGGEYSYSYTHQGQLLTETNPDNNRRSQAYDLRGYQTQATDFKGFTTNFELDALGNPLTITDALLKVTTNEYDLNGRVTKVIDPLFTQEFTYDALGRQISAIDRRGIPTLTEYNYLDLPIKTTRNGVVRSSNSYYPDGQLSEAYDGEGNRTFYEYDGLKRVTLESGEHLAINQYVHNTEMRTRKVTSPDGVVTEEQYDVRGNLLTTTTDGAKTEFEYDLANNQEKLIDPKGRETQYTYDKLNRRESITDAEGNITRFFFDDLGRKRTHTDGNDIVTTFGYDANSNLESILYASSLEIGFGYDTMNNRISYTQPQGITTYGYDDLHRLKQQKDSTGIVDYTLDGNGNVTQTLYTNEASSSLPDSVKAAESESAIYDNFDRVIEKTDIAGLKTQYLYTKNDQIKRTTYPNGDSSLYEYDKRNRISKAQLTSGNVSYRYYADDTLKQIDYSNGAQSKYQYTPRNQSEQIRHTLDDALLAELNYTYDKNDNRKTESKNFGQETLVTEYDFDELNRIEGIRYPAQYNETAKTVNYTFDAAHNRKTETAQQDGNTTSKVYGYNDLDQLVDINQTHSSLTNENKQTAYAYDNNGSVSQKVVTQNIGGASPDSTPTGTNTITTDYQFDIRQQLKTINGQEQLSTSPSATQTLAANYYYDASGQRLRTQYKDPTTNEITQAQHSVYQGIKLLSQYDVSASNNTDLSINANYQFSGGLNIGRRAFAEEDSSNNTQTFYHTDSLGSVLATSKFDHSIAARYDYDVWGNELNNTDTSDNPLGFTGHQMDRASENKTGLIYANARYLDPDTGRFLSFDPFEGYDEKPISLHRYMYAYQNPVRYIDPDGRMGMAPGPCNWRPCNTSDQRQQATEQYHASNKAAVEGIANFAADGIVDDYRSSQSASDFLSKRGDRIKDDFKDGVIAGVAATACGAAKVCKAVKNTAESAYENGAKKLSEFSDKAKSKLKTTKESDTDLNSDVCRCCFAGGTPILTKAGLIPIEQIGEGELVASRNEETGEVEWKPVTALFVNDDDRLTYSLILIDERGNEESYEVTDNHPFNVEGIGWVDAIDLKAGMQIPSYQSGYLTVVSIEGLNQSPITYNFEVDEFHTYFVGEQGAWVHNECACSVNRGVVWKDENAHKSERAQLYEDSTSGARTNIETKKQQAPALQYINKNPRGRNEVRFDGQDPDTSELIDRKINIAGSKKARNQVDRQAESLRQNDMEARWEVPNEKVQRRAERLLEKQGAEDVIRVEVVPE